MQQSSDKNQQVRPRIFVIEESLHIMEYLRLTLEYEGYEVIGCQEHSNALNVAKEVSPDLIILDIISSDEKGIILCKQLREEVAQEHPIILVVEEANTQIQQLTHEAVANALVTKPFKYEDIDEQIHRFIGYLRPALVQPKKGYMYRIDDPPPDLPPIIKRKSSVIRIRSFFLRLIDFRRRYAK